MDRRGREAAEAARSNLECDGSGPRRIQLGESRCRFPAKLMSFLEHGTALGTDGRQLDPLFSPPSRSQAPFMSTPSPNRTFQETLAVARAGDKEAINELFASFYPQVHRAVHMSLATDLRQGRDWLASRFSTGDVVQEIFCSVLGNLNSFGGSTEQAFTGYLSMVIRNRIIDAVRYHEAERRDGRRTGHELKPELHPSINVAPIDEALTNENAELYQSALLALDERERLLVRARFEDTATFQELSERLGYANEAAARRAFHGTVAKLSTRLKGENGGGEA